MGLSGHRCPLHRTPHPPPACPPASYGGDSHHHLAIRRGADAVVVGPQLAQDVQDGVATVVVENSPYSLAPPPSLSPLAELWGLFREPRPPALPLELIGSPRSLAFS